MRSRSIRAVIIGTRHSRQAGIAGGANPIPAIAGDKKGRRRIHFNVIPEVGGSFACAEKVRSSRQIVDDAPAGSDLGIGIVGICHRDPARGSGVILLPASPRGLTRRGSIRNGQSQNLRRLPQH